MAFVLFDFAIKCYIIEFLCFLFRTVLEFLEFIFKQEAGLRILGGGEWFTFPFEWYNKKKF